MTRRRGIGVSVHTAGFALLVVLALAYRCYALTGDMYHNPVIYAQNAFNLLQGTFSLQTDSIYAHRLPVFLPVAPLYALMGVGSVSSQLWPLLFSSAELLVLLWIGRRILDDKTAFLAALFLLLAPLDVVYSGVLQPDIFVAGLISAAAAFWIAALEDPRKTPVFFPLASGFAFALALISRENSLVLLVFYLAGMIWKRPRILTPVLAAVGAALVFAPLLVAYAVQTGDPFYRLKITVEAYAATPVQEGSRLSYYSRLLLHVRHTLSGPYPLLYAVGLVGGLVRPTRSRTWLLLWALPILLYQQFGSLSLTRYFPVLKREFLLLPLNVPLSLLTASVLLGVLATIGRRIRLPGVSPRRLQAAILGLCLLGLTGLSFLIVRDRRRVGMDNYRAIESVARVVQNRPGIPVLCDHWRTGYRLAYYLGFAEGADFYRGGDDRKRMARPGAFGNSRLGYLAWYPDSALVPSSLIVLDDASLEMVHKADGSGPTYYPGEIPAYAYSPPRSWRLLDQADGFRVYERGADPNR
jgi:hypothetical protein